MKPKRMKVLHISAARPVTRDRRCPWCAVPVRAGERLRTVTYSTGAYAYQVAVCEACTLGEVVR